MAPHRMLSIFPHQTKFYMSEDRKKSGTSVFSQLITFHLRPEEVKIMFLGCENVRTLNFIGCQGAGCHHIHVLKFKVIPAGFPPLQSASSNLAGSHRSGHFLLILLFSTAICALLHSLCLTYVCQLYQ